jgi:hypothetical protein
MRNTAVRQVNVERDLKCSIIYMERDPSSSIIYMERNHSHITVRNLVSYLSHHGEKPCQLLPGRDRNHPSG